MAANETRVPITSSGDIVTARQKGRSLAVELGFDGVDVTLITAAISEVSRNIIVHAKGGEIVLRPVHEGAKRGLCVVARDRGPGIPNVAQAMEYGYSTANGLGVGLPGAKWLMDDFDIQSKVGVGTTVTMKKWFNRHAK